jgi:hypothetical protein
MELLYFMVARTDAFADSEGGEEELVDSSAQLTVDCVINGNLCKIIMRLSSVIVICQLLQLIRRSVTHTDFLFPAFFFIVLHLFGFGH